MYEARFADFKLGKLPVLLYVRLLLWSLNQYSKAGLKYTLIQACP